MKGLGSLNWKVQTALPLTDNMNNMQNLQSVSYILCITVKIDTTIETEPPALDAEGFTICPDCGSCVNCGDCLISRSTTMERKSKSDITCWWDVLHWGCRATRSRKFWGVRAVEAQMGPSKRRRPWCTGQLFFWNSPQQLGGCGPQMQTSWLWDTVGKYISLSELSGFWLTLYS